MYTEAMEHRPVLPLEYETPPAKLPMAVAVTAWLFIAMGILALIDVVVALWNDRVNLNLAVAGVFIGWGLLRRIALMRSVALMALGGVLLIVPAAIFVGLLAGGFVSVGSPPRPATAAEATVF
jgi:hypothetical protein